MQQVWADPANYTSVYVDDSGAHYLYSVCSNVGWFAYCLRMSSVEVTAFRVSNKSASELSLAVCRNSQAYKSRIQPESFQKEHALTFDRPERKL